MVSIRNREYWPNDIFLLGQAIFSLKAHWSTRYKAQGFVFRDPSSVSTSLNSLPAILQAWRKTEIRRGRTAPFQWTLQSPLFQIFLKVTIFFFFYCYTSCFVSKKKIIISQEIESSKMVQRWTRQSLELKNQLLLLMLGQC